MTELRFFDSTQLLISSGFIFVDLYRGVKIAFMRRLQPEIHHGPQMPITMATVGGMFQPLNEMETDGSINAEGFKGRPMSLFENAHMHAMGKLGIWVNKKHAANYIWHVIDHPYYYGERTPNVRNVGKVMRQVYDVTDILEPFEEGLAKVNASKKPEERSELLWLSESQFSGHLAGNHSLKQGEIEYLRRLYSGLENKVDKPPRAVISLA